MHKCAYDSYLNKFVLVTTNEVEVAANENENGHEAVYTQLQTHARTHTHGIHNTWW